MSVADRKKHPQAVIDHIAADWKLPDGSRVLRVFVKVSNPGEAFLPVGKGLIRIQQLSSPESVLAERTFNALGIELDPGEGREYCLDFALRAEIESVIIHTWLENPHAAPPWWKGILSKERGAAWEKSSVHHLDVRERAKSATA